MEERWPEVAALVANPDGVPCGVRAMRQGFRALQRQGTAIESPSSRRCFFGPPLSAPIAYWRRYFARPAAELIFGRHLQAAAGEMLERLNELRAQMKDTPVSTSGVIVRGLRWSGEPFR